MSLNHLLKLQGKAPAEAPAKPVVESASAPVAPAPKPAGMGFPFKRPPADAPVEAVVESVIEEIAEAEAKTLPSDDPFDLAQIDLTGIGSQDPDSTGSDFERETVLFADLIDAQAPERTLPENITHQQQGFVSLLDSIYEIIQDPDLFSQAVRTIMSELQTHQEYAQLVGDRDVHVLIRGMRQTMGLARIKKA